MSSFRKSTGTTPAAAYVNLEEVERGEFRALPGFSPDERLDKIQLVFRHLGDAATGHWANTLAARLTAEPGDVHPLGKFCHVELCMEQSPNVWYRFSINKKTGTMDAKGKITYEKGRVHGLEISPGADEMKNYTVMILQVPRKNQLVAWKFLDCQIGAPFNMFAYVANVFWLVYLFPRPFGLYHFDERLLREQRTWFCSELVMTALQAMGINCYVHHKETKKLLQPRASNPNMLFRLADKFTRSAQFSNNIR